MNFETGKIYLDEYGRRWRVVGFVTDPAVIIEDCDNPHRDLQVWTLRSPLARGLKPEKMQANLVRAE